MMAFPGNEIKRMWQPMYMRNDRTRAQLFVDEVFYPNLAFIQMI